MRLNVIHDGRGLCTPQLEAPLAERMLIEEAQALALPPPVIKVAPGAPIVIARHILKGLAVDQNFAPTPDNRRCQAH